MEDFIYEEETYTLETLSPVHIGTGNRLGNVDFYENNNIIHRINIDKLVECLPENVISELVSYIENGRDLKPFVEKCKNDNEGDNEIILYSLSLGEKEREGNRKIRIKTLYENIKHPKGLYIPASTIKGAIRTAVLYCLLKEKKDEYKFSVKEFENKKGKKKDIVLEVRGDEIKGISNIENFLNREFFGENQSDDIFKYFEVSDSEVKKRKNNRIDDLECRKVYVANTTKFETRLPNGKKIQKHPEYYETIRSKVEFNNIKISVIQEKQLESLINPKYTETLRKMKNWKECLHEFAQDLIEAEIQFWDKENVENMIKQAYSHSPHKYLVDLFDKDKVIKQLEEMKEKNTSEEPVIRIGKLTGYLTHSIGLLLATNPNKPYDVHIFGRILNNRAKNHLFPLTRRLTLDNQTLGWCKLKKIQQR